MGGAGSGGAAEGGACGRPGTERVFPGPFVLGGVIGISGGAASTVPTVRLRNRDVTSGWVWLHLGACHSGDRKAGTPRYRISRAAKTPWRLKRDPGAGHKRLRNN
jgi:hypothetical protein